MSNVPNDNADLDEAISLSNFAAIIRSNTGIQNGTVDLAALVIWKLVEAHIEESENRIIDAEFAKTEAENKLMALKAS